MMGKSKVGEPPLLKKELDVLIFFFLGLPVYHTL